MNNVIIIAFVQVKSYPKYTQLNFAIYIQLLIFILLNCKIWSTVYKYCFITSQSVMSDVGLYHSRLLRVDTEYIYTDTKEHL